MMETLTEVKRDKTEANTFRKLQNYFQKNKEDVLMMKNLQFMELTGKQGEAGTFAKDVLLVNLTRRLLISLDVAQTFSKESIEKMKAQLKSSFVLLNEWCGGDLTEESEWEFAGVFYIDEEGQEYYPTICPDCSIYVIFGI